MKDLKNIKALYDLGSIDKAQNVAKTFKDAGGVILARNLEHVSSEIFTQEYAGLTFLNQGITVNNEGGAATSIRKVKLAVNGEFRESGTSTDTTGKITLTGESDSIPVFTMEASSNWSEVELKQAELENINLPSRFFEGHAELYNRKIDTLGYLGQTRTDGTQKTLGLLNSPWTTSAAGGTAQALTGEALYGEIAELINAQWAEVLNVETYMADRVIMPSDVYNVCFSKILNTAGSHMSVMAALKANFPTIQFGATTKAVNVGGDSITIALSSDKRAMQFRLPTPLNISNIDQRGFKYYVESYFGVAGLDIIESTSAQTLTGL